MFIIKLKGLRLGVWVLKGKIAHQIKIAITTSHLNVATNGQTKHSSPVIPNVLMKRNAELVLQVAMKKLPKHAGLLRANLDRVKQIKTATHYMETIPTVACTIKERKRT